MSIIRYPSMIIVFIIYLSFLSCIKNESLYQTDKLSNVASLPSEKSTQSPQRVKDTLNVLYHWKGEGGREQFLKEYAQLYRWHNQDIHLNLCDMI